jgi:hydroxymethylglutaryl-CoA reductase (NADPH)
MGTRGAGWLHINGGLAKGDFPIPFALAEDMATIAYDRVTRVLNASGGVTCTIADEAMERAPAFVFSSAREARAFRGWMGAHLAEIRSAAESAAPAVKLQSIGSQFADNIVLVRFDFDASSFTSAMTLDAAVRAACESIRRANPAVLRDFVMTSGTRRITAKAKIAGALLREQLGIDLEAWRDQAVLGTVGRSSTAVLYSDVTPHDELYLSIMIPELVPGTGGDHLDTLGCAGPGNASKLAEIVAAAALATWLSRECRISARARAG